MAISTYLASLSIVKLLGNMPGGIAQGLIWGLMAIGVYVTYRLLDVADLTVDGTFSLGGAVAVMLIIGGCPAWLAVIVATVSGIAAGFCTGMLHVKLGIPAILAGILTQFSLYSINLSVMGMAANKAVSVDKFTLLLSSRSIPKAIVVAVLFGAAMVALYYWFFGTETGCSLRATGSNAAMSAALGINVGRMKILGLAISNGIVAMSGSLMAQFQGFADVNMGRGAIVIGLAAVIIGEVLGKVIFGKRMNFALTLVSVIIGGIVYYLVVVLALWLRINSNYLKLITAVIVALFLAVPYIREQQRTSFSRLKKKEGGKNA